jgi:hypothetical protein
LGATQGNVVWLVLMRTFAYLFNVEFSWRLVLVIVFTGTISAFFDGMIVAHNEGRKYGA